MGKGNHVFNHFQKSVDNAFARMIENAGWDAPPGSTVKLSLARAKTLPTSEDAQFLATRLPKAWPKFREIIGSMPFARWDEMQDDNPVASNDPNSRSYGDVANSFAGEIAKLGRLDTLAGANPGFYWTKMIAAGYDDGAARNWIGAARPAEQNSRKARIAETQRWISGPLNGLVNTWIQYLRLDMEGKR
jgi:hypothetical protein